MPRLYSCMLSALMPIVSGPIEATCAASLVSSLDICFQLLIVALTFDLLNAQWCFLCLYLYSFSLSRPWFLIAYLSAVVASTVLLIAVEELLLGERDERIAS